MAALPKDLVSINIPELNGSILIRPVKDIKTQSRLYKASETNGELDATKLSMNLIHHCAVAPPITKEQVNRMPAEAVVRLTQAIIQASRRAMGLAPDPTI